MYDTMSEKEKKQTLEKMYVFENKSLAQIATNLNTYPNKIRRDAKKFNIELRNKSEAQKNALNKGTHNHPTKGKKRQQEVKDKIGQSVMKSWENLTEEELFERREQSRLRWLNLSQEQKDNMLKLANEAVRKSSKEGSKLEKFLLSKLLADGYKVNFHQEHILSNSKLQIDIFIPRLNLAIEVDGPSHFEEIWGTEALSRNTKYDQKKEGLLVGKGLKLLRVRQNGDFSKARAERTYIKIKKFLQTSSLDPISYIEY